MTNKPTEIRKTTPHSDALQFFTYRQNNSGGSFDYNEDAGISITVIVQARSADEANRVAQGIGLYFDGDGDCPCCGDRWYEAYGEGDPVPSIYGDPVTEYNFNRWRWVDEGQYECFVHYSDGRVEGYGAN